VPSWFEALVLGVVQGLTEFIPVSSSAHLVLVPAYFGWERPGLAFDVALHVGTLAALLVYYRRDLWHMGQAVLVRRPSPAQQIYRRLAWLMALATVPVGVAGIWFRSSVELAFESPLLASSLLFGTAALLLTGELVRRRRVRSGPAPDHRVAGIPDGHEDPLGQRFGADADDPRGTDLARLSGRQALLVGFGQALAILPGLSRSGTTITAGLVAGLARPAATRFAFLLAMPAIAGATVVSIPDLGELGHYSFGDLAVGMAAAAVAGYVAISVLVALVSRAGLQRFVVYLVILGAVGLVRFS